MSDWDLYLFDDHRARRWAPFTLTRPAGELAYGAALLRERAERTIGTPCRGYLTRSALAGFDEPSAPPVVERDSVTQDSTRVLLSSRVVVTRFPDTVPDEPNRLTLDGVTVGWTLPPGEPLPSDELLRFPESDERRIGLELRGSSISRPWNLLNGTVQQLAEDLLAEGADDETPAGVIRVGEAPLTLGRNASVEPGVVVDTRRGPVRLDEGARVEGPARLVGPLLVGRDSIVLGGSVGRSYVGPVCKVRGEVSDSILLAFVNKAHDGHLGHAVLGRWVNLGAQTTNSDLKNNYGPVRVWTLEGEIDTGLQKMGCLLGDHVKTGIGTLINTGTVVGAGSNIFGGLMPPLVVPPFSWGSGTDLRDYRLDKFFEVAERSMARRGQQLSPGTRSLLARAWRETRIRRAV